MPRPAHYSPALERFIVSVLYHEARHRNMPMTRLTNEILKDALVNSKGWQLALATQSHNDRDQPSTVAGPGN